MRWLKRILSQPWSVALVAGSLIALIALSGLVGLVNNLYVKEITDGSLRHAVHLETRSNQLRSAAFDMRYYHRNLLLDGTTQERIRDFDDAYERLRDRIDSLDRLGVRNPDVLQPDRLRQIATSYYNDFRPAIGEYDADSRQFWIASDRSLEELAEIERAADALEASSAQGAEEAVNDLERAEDVERVVLIAVALGLVLALAALAYTGMRMVRLIGELRDLYSREQATAEALRESEERFRSLVQYSSDIITVFDEKGGIRYVSPSVGRVLGHPPGEMFGQNAFAFVHPEDSERVLEDFASLLSQPGVRRPIEFRIRHANGSWRFFEAVANNMLEDPAMRGIVVTSRDITERKRAEEAVTQTVQMKTDFLADVSHELRTPLTVLRSNAEFGLAVDRDWPHREILEEIVKESARMTRMVEDLLFLARSDSAPQPLDLQQVAVPLFVAELAGHAEVLAREHGASFESETSGDGWLSVDPARVEQAVLTLVDNAARYGYPGGIVRLASSTRDGELCIEVEDEGAGIPEAELPRIFDRFYRVGKARSRKRGGSGLGLSIARTIAELHGGRIEAESQVGKGTRMTLCLPLLLPSAHRAASRTPAQEG